MTDDLVKRLRLLADKTVDLPEHYAITEAADRIEALEKALEYYAKNHYPNVDDGPWGQNSNDFGDVARAALERKDD